MGTKVKDLHPTPWSQDETWIQDADGFPVGNTLEHNAAARIVAAVNSVAGLPTAMLENGVVRRLVEKHIDTLAEEIPGLRELLKEPRPH